MPNNEIVSTTHGRVLKKKAGRSVKSGSGVPGSSRSGVGALKVTTRGGGGNAMTSFVNTVDAATRGNATQNLDDLAEPGLHHPVTKAIRKSGKKGIKNLSNKYKVVP